MMVRKPTYAGNVAHKDETDILLWSSKTPLERLAESWRLNCVNHGIPLNSRLDKTASVASLRNSG